LTDPYLQQLKLGKKISSSDQLDPVPRELSRQHVKFPKAFFGEDLWNCFEASFLLPSGLPVLLHLQVRYAAQTPNMVESKSFKLFLNHFNFETFDSVADYLKTIRVALAACVGGNVEIEAFAIDQSPAHRPLPGMRVDDFEPLPYPEQPDANLLKAEADEAPWMLHSHLLRSRCPVTDQPDWGAVIIHGMGSYRPDARSLLSYILSFRNHQGFHEACCEQIFADLFEVLQPAELSVRCLYTRRGGLDINPFRTTKSEWEPYPFLAWRQ
jgi:7-cyano-7-deazaguanine reductase